MSYTIKIPKMTSNTSKETVISNQSSNIFHKQFSSILLPKKTEPVTSCTSKSSTFALLTVPIPEENHNQSIKIDNVQQYCTSHSNLTTDKNKYRLIAPKEIGNTSNSNLIKTITTRNINTTLSKVCVFLYIQ